MVLAICFFRLFALPNLSSLFVHLSKMGGLRWKVRGRRWHAPSTVGDPQPMSVPHCQPLPSCTSGGPVDALFVQHVCTQALVFLGHSPLVSILMGREEILSTWLVAFLSFWEIPDVLGPVPGRLVAEK